MTACSNAQCNWHFLLHNKWNSCSSVSKTYCSNWYLAPDVTAAMLVENVFWEFDSIKLERNFAIVSTANMAVWSPHCNPRIQGGVAILIKQKFQKHFARFHQKWHGYNETNIASTSDQEIIKTGPWDLRTKSSLNSGRQTCGSRQNFTDLLGCRYVSSSMPQGCIVWGFKKKNIGSSENSHLRMNEKQLRNHKKWKKKRAFKACKTTVIHCYICNVYMFLRPSSLWLFKLPLM